MNFTMPMLDGYFAMSNNTDPANADSRLVAQAADASGLPAASRPWAYASFEVRMCLTPTLLAKMSKR